MSRFLFVFVFALVGCDPTLDKGGDTDPSDDTASLLDEDSDGFSPSQGDCDDSDPIIYPEAEELCDGVDNDCDGAIDDATVAQWFADTDEDGYGNPQDPSFSCQAPAGYVANDADCDDTSDQALPGGTEVCDELDNNCDGTVDEGVTITFYEDADGDGAGDGTLPVEACERGWYAGTSDDCDDANPAAYPGLAEICDEIDNDCNGEIDDGVTTTWYRDTDGDGWGDLAVAVDACEPPDGYTDNSGDTDDTNPDVNPGATELCNGIDDDADGLVDEADALDATTWYVDTDGDGHGDPAVSVVACDEPLGYVAVDDDPDDGDGGVYPGATEYCNGIDDDVDGSIDEADAVDILTWFADVDSDTFGDPATATTSCTQPANHVADDTDCDDAATTTHPGANEQCNADDDDCDGVVDDNVVYVDWFVDADADGWGDPDAAPVNDCVAPAGHIDNDEDCDDADSAVNPAEVEFCDGIDDDCDGIVDEDDASDAASWYADTDADGYGDAAVTDLACDAPTGFVADDDDCDDTDDAIHPTAAESCNGVDDDCDRVTDESDAIDADTWYADADADGYGSLTATRLACTAPSGYLATSTDCDDSDAATHPGGTETCDGEDDDCDAVTDEGFDADSDTIADCFDVEMCDGYDNDGDGTVDESDAADALTWYADLDGDGYGDSSTAVTTCTSPVGYVGTGGDCDDTDATVSGGVTETCDGIDNDCDGTIDEASASDVTTWYRDADADGYGRSTTYVVACDAPLTYVSNANDCNDLSALIHPGASESCNSVDDDCDGVTDEGVGTTYYRDADTDGYGTTATTSVSCTVPSGYVANSTDCDDASSSVHPGAVETCNSTDDDCDGTSDEGVTTTYYRDVDTDGYGTLVTTTTGCSAPSGYVATSTDCDDANSAVRPGAVETCNSTDDDCDGLTDEGVATTYYRDADADGYGTSTTTTTGCSTPIGYVATSSDCDDGVAAVHPGATESCNLADDDCDGLTDEGALATYYLDADADGYGTSATTTTGCSAPVGYVGNLTDCNDSSASAHPGGVETCNSVDDDCDGTTDEGVATTYYRDADSDGYGALATTREGCSVPAGYVADSTDCNDATSAVNPAAVETCNSVDDDCDSVTDEGVTTMYYRDADSDGYGNLAVSTPACSAAVGYVTNSTDCNDGSATIKPGAVETCNSTDDDCDGTTDEGVATTYYRDADGDGYGTTTTTTTGCSAPSGYVASSTDCDDASSAVKPGAVETCNSTDDDCDGYTDESVTITYYRDADADGYGTSTLTTTGCSLPAGYATNATDCNDSSSTVRPGATETCNSIDDDCDTFTDEGALVTYYRDADADGYGLSTSTTTGCAAPAGYVANLTDCNDASALISPAAIETCNSTDDDCDGTTDEGVSTTYYRDVDGDGYGVSTTTLAACSLPVGYVTTSTDCLDTSALSYPGAAETCSNSIDEDCDGTADDGCPAVVTHCAPITANETWSGTDTHRVTCDIAVGSASAPTLTIQDGARVEFSAGTGISVGTASAGKLLVQGTTTGVTFTRVSTAASAWDGLSFGAYDRNSVIDGATIELGGANTYGNVYVSGALSTTARVTITDSVISDSTESGVWGANGARLDISNTEISDNADDGVHLDTNSYLYATGGPNFTDNVITGNDDYPVVINPTQMHQLDSTSTYAGNGIDRIYVYTGTVATDATWQALDVPYYIVADLTIGAAASPTLTIEDGATLLFAGGAGINVGSGAEGALDAGAVTFTSLTTVTGTPYPGDWDGITFNYYDQDSILDGSTVEYGGGNGYGNIYGYWNSNGGTVTIIDATITDSSQSGIYGYYLSKFDISGTTIADNAQWGLYLDTNSMLATTGGPTFTDNVLTGNESPMKLMPEYVGQIDASTVISGNLADDYVHVWPGTITLSATWQDIGVPYFVTGDVYVYSTSSPTLTLEDGVEVDFDYGTGLNIGTSSYGKLNIDGTSARVLLTAASNPPSDGDWDGVYFGSYDTGSDLYGADILYAGANGYGNIYMVSSGTSGSTIYLDDCLVANGSNSGIYASGVSRVYVKNSEISDNADYGVYLGGSGVLSISALPTFTNNVVTGNGDYPIYLSPLTASMLDSSSTYIGNGTDAIQLPSATMTTSNTWQALDVPYRMAGDLNVYDATGPTLTLMPGVDMQFVGAAGLNIGTNYYGALYAVGTSAQPITFTGVGGAYWYGIYLGYYIRPSTMSYLDVSYGGTNGYGNFRFYNVTSTTSLSNSTVSYSAQWGIYRQTATPTLTNITYVSNTAGTLY